MSPSFLFGAAIAIVLLIALAFLGIFLAAVFSNEYRPIAQAIAPVLGAFIGVMGVFLVTQLQFAKQTEQRSADADLIGTWLAGDVLNVGLQVHSALFRLLQTNLPDGRLTPSYFKSLTPPKLDRFRDSRVDWRLISPAQLQHLEYIEQTLNAYRTIVDQASSQAAAVPDDLQRQFWGQLDHIRGQVGAYLRNFGRPDDQIFAKQFESFTVSQFAPTPGQAYSGQTVLKLLENLNKIAEENAHKS
jgi:hypothetical protein